MPFSHLFPGFFAVLLLVSCQKESPAPASSAGGIQIRLRHISMGDTLRQGFPVKDSSGVVLALSKFQYYLSGVRLESANPMETYREKDSYHLVKGLENNGESNFSLSAVPSRPYRALLLQIGLDSITNHKAGGTGALDPGKGMYWTWSNEYKFMVLEGSFQYPDTSGAFLFHVAGDACYRTIRIPLEDASGNPVLLESGSVIRLNVNLAALLGAPRPVDFRTMNNVMSVESGAVLLADNYANAGFIRLSGFN